MFIRYCNSSFSKVFPRTVESPIAVGNKDFCKGCTDISALTREKIIDNFQCDTCLRYKVDGRVFGHLLARAMRTAC